MDAMDEKIEMLLYGQYYKKLQKAVYAPLLQQYQITLLDLRVMLFLDGNKQRNTARDIVEIHYFTKSDVSKSIESLMEKGYLAKNRTVMTEDVYTWKFCQRQSLYWRRRIVKRRRCCRFCFRGLRNRKLR